MQTQTLPPFSHPPSPPLCYLPILGLSAPLAARASREASTIWMILNTNMCIIEDFCQIWYHATVAKFWLLSLPKNALFPFRRQWTNKTSKYSPNDRHDMRLSLSTLIYIVLRPFNLEIALPVTADVGKLSSKFHRCMVFRFRVDGGHGTDKVGCLA